MVAERRLLDSWKDISDYLKRDVRTCQRYERQLGLPVHRLEQSAKARVLAYTDEIDAWREKRFKEEKALAGRAFGFLRGKPLLAGIAAVLIIILGVIIVPLAIQQRGSERLAIAVLPFENASGRPELDNCTSGIPRLLIQSLSGSHYFEVLSNAQTLGALRELNFGPSGKYTAAELEALTGRLKATHTVTGVLIKVGSGLVVGLSVGNRGSDDAYSSRFECDDEAAAIKAVGRMADEIKKALGLTRSPEAGDYDAWRIPVTTSSLEAFRLYNEGRRLHLTHDFSRSAHMMRCALHHDPTFALAWRSLWASYGELGNEEEAEKCIVKALECSRDASIREQFWIRVDYFSQASEIGKALQAAFEWSALFPEDTQAQMLIGRSYMHMEDPRAARAYLAASLSQGDSNPYTFYFAALASTAMGQFEYAARIYDRGLSIHPENTTIIRARIANEIAQGWYDQALRDSTCAELARPGTSFDLLSGDILLLKGDFAAAESRYHKSRPLSPDSLTRLSRLALAEGRYGRAEELAEKAKNWQLLAYIEARRGRLGEASKEADRALRVTGGRVDAYMELGAIQMKGMLEALKGDLRVAEAAAQRLRQTGGAGIGKAQERAALFVEGLMESAAGRPAAAVDKFSSAIELLPHDYVPMGPASKTHSIYIFYAAQENAKSGNEAAARQLYERLIDLGWGRLAYPDLFALSHYALGRIAEAHGDAEAARRRYETFLSLWRNADPDCPGLDDARTRLGALKGPRSG